MIDLRDYVAAAILFDISEDSNSPFLRGSDISDITLALAHRYSGSELPEKLVSSTVERIIKNGGGRVISDPFTRDYVYLQEHLCSDIYTRLIENEDSPYGKAARIGRKFLEEALTAFMSLPHTTLVSGFYEVDPAAEIITIDLEQPDAQRITTVLEDIREKIATDNEVGDLLADQRQPILVELDALIQVWKSTRIRVIAFISRAESTLSWISEKAASSVVSEMAKNALKALWDFLL